MSVLIKGMDIPRCCSECPYAEDYGEEYSRKCQISGSYVNLVDIDDIFDFSEEIKTVRDDDCPLVEVPTPHGRLIDVDALQQTIIKEVNSGEPGEQFAAIDVIQLIESAPTIIEAEE